MLEVVPGVESSSRVIGRFGVYRAKTQPKADQPQIAWLSQARKGKSLFSDPRIGFPWRPLRLCARYSGSVAGPPRQALRGEFRIIVPI